MPISSARVKVFVVPGDGGNPISLGIVEDLRIDKDYQGEILHTLGAGPGVDRVLNTERGTLQWGRVPTINQAILDAIVPRIARWTEYGGMNLLIVDAKSGKPIALAIGCIPETEGFTFQNGRAVRENFRGQCQYTVLNEETEEAGSASALAA